jgi:hypothetical protein
VAAVQSPIDLFQAAAGPGHQLCNSDESTLVMGSHCSDAETMEMKVVNPSPELPWWWSGYESAAMAAAGVRLGPPRQKPDQPNPRPRGRRKTRKGMEKEEEQVVNPSPEPGQSTPPPRKRRRKRRKRRGSPVSQPVNQASQSISQPVSQTSPAKPPIDAVDFSSPPMSPIPCDPPTSPMTSSPALPFSWRHSVLKSGELSRSALVMPSSDDEHDWGVVLLTSDDDSDIY